jgi:hypothetical protein
VQNDTGETIIHLEDGSYWHMSAEDVYNHMFEEHRCKDIKESLSPKYSKETGKQYKLMKWTNDYESLVDADILKRDEPGSLV